MLDWSSFIDRSSVDFRRINPPGCVSDYVTLPSGHDGSCKIGLVQEHRFAFFYWALHSSKQNGHPPTLLTLDYHNDIGSRDDVRHDELKSLDLNNRLELALFSWLRLRPNNDGHVLPALHLNFFSDVVALLSTSDDGDNWQFEPEHRQMEWPDRYGSTHQIYHCPSAQEALEVLNGRSPIYLDIDLDFFTRENPATGKAKGSELCIPENEIWDFFTSKEGLIQGILPRVVGMTIALEPTYCGGINNSMHILELLNNALFGGTLFTDRCKWRHLEV